MKQEDTEIISLTGYECEFINNALAEVDFDYDTSIHNKLTATYPVHPHGRAAIRFTVSEANLIGRGISWSSLMHPVQSEFLMAEERLRNRRVCPECFIHRDLASFTVEVKAEGVAEFNRRWPCSKLPEVDFTAQFDQDRNLIDTSIPDVDSSGECAAIINDAEKYLFDYLVPFWA